MTFILDPVHGHINIKGFEKIINHPLMQRLRYIKQDSLLYHAFPSAKHDRFSHSLGTFHVMSQVVENNNFNEEDSYHLKAAALLHDIGHGPYSHLWERMIPEYDHEEISQKIITEIFQLPVVAKIINKEHPLSELLSSVVDVDKLDYLARDSYFCGVGYGFTDLERITKYLTIKEGKLSIPQKLVNSIEHVILARLSLYTCTYFHHAVRAKDMNLTSIIKRVKYLQSTNQEVFIDSTLAQALQGKVILDDLVKMTDTMIEYHLHQWKEADDKILQDLVQRFFKRKGFVAKESDQPLPQTTEFDPEYYLLEDEISKEIYESEIYVYTKEKEHVALSEFSQLVKQIKHLTIKKRFIIGPQEILKK